MAICSLFQQPASPEIGRIAPIATVLAGNAIAILFVLIVGGLREIGEPARKALIVSLAKQAVRGRTIGLNNFIRGLNVSPASLVDGRSPGPSCTTTWQLTECPFKKSP